MTMRILTLLGWLACLTPLCAEEKPNILWITSEDNAFHWLGCYGNTQVNTPRLDTLAAGGIRFTHAYSNAPVCAVARSTILNGAYAPTQGTQHMRSRYPIEEKFKSYVHYLRQAGYYCTNQSKTDYNFRGNDNAIWDECSGKAHYRKRPDGKPFFSIFNLTTTHESSLFGKGAKKSAKTGIQPSEVIVPPYLPDLPEIRSDLAFYHDIIQQLDTQVGALLDELQQDGLSENTIVFYYSDHGGILPRGKRYLEDTGVRVPMIVHLPKKWAHLSPFKAGSTPEEPVAFVDLAPTLLSLIGLDTPPQMQGRPFLGERRKEPAKDATVYLYADRFDEINGMRRGITDGRWKYIRRFTPQLPAAPYSFYQFGQAGWKAWEKAWQDKSIAPEHARIWEAPQPTEDLFDTQGDPWEIRNLANDPQHAERLQSMRAQLRQMMIDTRDTSIIPESMFETLADKQPVSTTVSSHGKDLPALVDLAFAASSADPKSLPTLVSHLSSENPIARYWAAHGCAVLGKAAEPAADALLKRTKDPIAGIRIAAADALQRMGRDSSDLLIGELSKDSPEMVRLSAINTIRALGIADKIPDPLRKKLSKENKGYVQRMVQELK